MQNVKSIGTGLLCVLISLMLVLSAVSCATNQSDNTEASQTGSTVSEEESGYKPEISKKDYNCDFNVVLGGNWVKDLYLPDSEEGQSDNGVPFAVYERWMKIKDQLGVTMQYVDGGSWTEYASTISRSVQSGDEDYQMVMTHVYQGIVELVTNNCLYDFADLPSVNLEADYWNRDLMDQIKVEDQYLLGYNDFCLSLTHTIVFNKDLMDKYRMTAPYDLVRNKQWTIDRLLEMASEVSEDSNGDGKMDWNDTYGMTGWGWTFLISFVTSSDLKIVDRDENDHYYIAYEDNEEKTIALIDKVKGMYESEYSYMWKSSYNPEQTVPFESGRTLFQLYDSTALQNLRGEDIRFGVLPYPLWDENQENYRSLNWNGVIGIPGVVRNPEMVSDVLELSAYYTEPVKIAYYEQLLGAKVADAPDDVDMLNTIWASQVSDVGLVFCNASGAMDSLVYLLPKLCESPKTKFASFMRSNKKNAQAGLDKVFDSALR